MKFKKSIYHIQIADMLRDMIMTGELRHGDKVNENKLCSSLEVSKTPLREALRVLSSEGLIELVPNRGAFVTQPEFTEIKEMFDVMILLEGFCARTACEKMSPKDFVRLEKLHDRLEQKVEHSDQEGYIQINNQYHSLVQELAGNRSLNQIIEGLRKRILLYRFQSLNAQGRMAESIQEHRELLEVFRQRDHQKAEVLMQTHLKKQFTALKELVQHSETAPE
ncbi:MAG: GntR family transcriptional regulator [Deltaproteobacteria bacterium]|nr:GntR family transcriptional regulator [Deltaproteobacteria bacterium]